MSQDEPVLWHRLLGVLLEDFFAGTAWTVETERDLSVQQQRLDFLILRRGEGPEPPLWPDGLDGPARHFLVTFKSLREALDVKALQELVGHLVAYQKLASPSPASLLPDELFRMVAVSMRFPDGLRRAVGADHLIRLRDGVYDLDNPVAPARILVLRDMPRADANVLWNLFSGRPEVIADAYEQWRDRLAALPDFLRQLWNLYAVEGVPMPYTKADFIREGRARIVADLTPEEVAALKPEQLTGLKAEQLARLNPDQLATLSLEQRLAGLTPEQIREYLRTHFPPAPDEPAGSRP